MKTIITIILITAYGYAGHCQDVYLIPTKNMDDSTQWLNISNNPDQYDNQPSFFSNDSLLFASTRNGQTDIRLYQISKQQSTWISNTPNGSEYSPTKIPNQPMVSAIRLDEDGKQLLYQYDLAGNIQDSITSLIIGYHAWISPNQLITFVLGDTSQLYLIDRSTGSQQKLADNIGRSLHKIPNENAFSYIQKSDDKWDIVKRAFGSEQIEIITACFTGVEDLCWMPDGTLLMGQGNTLYQYVIGEGWQPIQVFTMGIISRIGVSPNGAWLAIVFSQ